MPRKQYKPLSKSFQQRAPLYALRHYQGIDLSITSDPSYTEYPKDWDDIATYIKVLAKRHCEHCGHVDNLATRHTLTTHHLDMVKSNCLYTNLVALCQRCHLYVQSCYVVNQGWLFDDFIPPWVKKRHLHHLVIQPGDQTSFIPTLT